MIKAANRLRATRHIQKALQKGINWLGIFFKVKANHRFGASANQPTRLAVIVTKKLALKSVPRNRLRRRLKAAFRDPISQINGWDVVIFPAPQAIDAKFEDLEREVRKCLDFLRSRR